MNWLLKLPATHTNDKKEYYLDLSGIYQVKNLLTVLEFIHQLRQKGCVITDQQLQKVFTKIGKETYRFAWQMGNNP